MKNIFFAGLMAAALLLFSCNDSQNENTQAAEETTETPGAGQSAVKDDESAKDVVKVAVSSPDHTTLVTALKQADLVNSLSNAGPFTVFAPTNSAFAKLPKETLDNLMKDKNKGQLQDILQYHVYVGTLSVEILKSLETLNQVNGANVTISVRDGKILLNNSATVIASIPASNGMIHVIDAVLLPQSKK